MLENSPISVNLLGVFFVVTHMKTALLNASMSFNDCIHRRMQKTEKKDDMRSTRINSVGFGIQKYRTNIPQNTFSYKNAHTGSLGYKYIRNWCMWQMKNDKQEIKTPCHTNHSFYTEARSRCY